MATLLARIRHGAGATYVSGAEAAFVLLHHAQTLTMSFAAGCHHFNVHGRAGQATHF
jgi:hypothetical protein